MNNTQLDNFTAQKQFTDTGIEAVKTHSGQKRAYGDSYYEYEVASELPQEDVERFCREKLYRAIPESQWRTENNSASNHFRPYYTFNKLTEGKYFYQVVSSYAD